MTVQTDRLVYMANQIAKFFAAQPGDDQPAAVADHLRAFWDPSMRRAILAHLRGGGAGLDPLAARAVALLETVPAIPPAAGRAQTATAPGDDAG